MPELPEVETVKNHLKRLILGKSIKTVEVYYPKIIKNMEVKEFIESLKGQTVRDIGRKGKYLLFVLTDMILVSHLRMEGKYFLKTGETIGKHEHLIFRFTDGTDLRYHDVRKFGTMNLFKTLDLRYVLKEEPLSRVGFDPFEDDLNIEHIIGRFQKISKPIKTTLLDQSIISGIGNIYVDEICFLSGIHPLTSTKTLSAEQVETIIAKTKEVLLKAIKSGGTTIRSFASQEISGRFQNELMVHTKTACPVCNQKILKIKIGGRTTYFCRNCQKPLEGKPGKKLLEKEPIC